jgi:hypothetical protein
MSKKNEPVQNEYLKLNVEKENKRLNLALNFILAKYADYLTKNSAIPKKLVISRFYKPTYDELKLRSCDKKEMLKVFGIDFSNVMAVRPVFVCDKEKLKFV